MGAAFLCVSFFGRAKKETRRAGAKPRIRSGRGIKQRAINITLVSKKNTINQ
jgi:hypothetical protein